MLIVYLLKKVMKEEGQYEYKDEYKEKFKKKELRLGFPEGLSHTDCPQCFSPIAEDQIQADGQVVCHNCGHQFQIALTDIEIFERTKPHVYLPRGMEYLKLNSLLEFIYKPKGSFTGPLLFFTLFWNAFVGLFVLTAFASGDVTSLLFLSLHILVGIFLLMKTFGDFVNKTYVTIDQDYLNIEKKPLQLFKRKAILTKDIQQLFVKKYSDGSVNDKPIYSYGLYARMKDKSEKRILDNFATPEHAQFIEQEIEIFLGINDEQMPQEV